MGLEGAATPEVSSTGATGAGLLLSAPAPAQDRQQLVSAYAGQHVSAHVSACQKSAHSSRC